MYNYFMNAENLHHLQQLCLKLIFEETRAGYPQGVHWGKLPVSN